MSRLNRCICRAIYCIGFILAIGSVQAVRGQAEADFEFLADQVASFDSNELNQNFYAVKVSLESTYMLPVILRSLGNGWFITTPESVKQLELLGANFSAWAVHNDWKKSDNIQDKPKSGSFLIGASNTQEVVERFSKYSIEYRAFENGFLVANLTPELFNQILEWKEIYYIGDEQLEALPESRVLDLNLVPNRIRQLFHNYPQIRGEGQLISIKENAYDATDIDLWGRTVVTPKTAEEIDNHTTEMATIIAGAGNSSVLGHGVAPQASITSSFYHDLFPDNADYFSQWGIQVQNHSYGTRIENFYGAMATAYDVQAWENPYVLHVFSSGNAGLEVANEGKYAGVGGFANLTGNFKMAKNTMLVGAVDTVDKLVSFVSNGPTFDGRVKPDLVAYSVFGSSNAAALTSGVSLLLQEKYQRLHLEPAPAPLLKAILINSAKDIHTPGPDFKTGFGGLNAYGAMKTLESGNYFSGILDGQDSESFTIQLPSNVAEFKATLVWHDPAAQVNSTVALVHDLDFQLVDSENGLWQPWVLNPNPNQLKDEAQRRRDSLNNVEQITISNPPSGEIILNVVAYNELTRAQPFYIAYEWKMKEQFNWVFPSGSDQMPYNGETTGYFQWESTLNVEKGELSVSYDDGASWESLASEVDLGRGYYRWRPPDTTSLAKARLVIDREAFVSDEFVIHTTGFPRVGYFCADSTRIAWKHEPAALQYEVLNWSEGQMETIATTNDTAIVLYKNSLSSTFLAVRSVLKGGKRTIASPAINYEFGTGCYLNSFFISETEENQVLLDIELGTIAGINRVRIYHRVGQRDFELLDDLEPGRFSQRTKYLHQQPNDGYNGYELELVFENGEKLRSQELSIYWLDVLQAAVFPNPIESGGDLNVFLRDDPKPDHASFTLYNSSGHILFTESIIAKGYSFRMPELAKGIYFYRVSNGLGAQRGRLIIK